MLDPVIDVVSVGKTLFSLSAFRQGIYVEAEVPSAFIPCPIDLGLYDHVVVFTRSRELSHGI